MIYQVTYSSPEDITPAGLDGREVSFPFLIVKEELVGLPEEQAHRSAHRIVVSVSGSFLATWRLSDSDLLHVLFEFGRRFLRMAISSGSAFGDYTIRMPMITTLSNPGR